MSPRTTASALRSAFHRSFPTFRLRHPLWLVPACLLLLSGCALVPYAQGIAGLLIAVATLLGLAACGGGDGAAGEEEGGTSPIVWPSVVSLDDLTSATGFILEGPSDASRFGASVAAGVDVNGDGDADFIVGSPYYTSATNAGQATLIFGDADIGETLFASGTPFDITTLGAGDGVVFNPQGGSQNVGYSVALARNFSGSSLGDIVIGAPQLSGADRGEAFVIFGDESLGGVRVLNVSSEPGAGAFFTGEAIEVTNPNSYDPYANYGAYNNLGFGVAALDINGDGLSDVVLGAPTNYNFMASGGPFYTVHPRTMTIFGAAGITGDGNGALDLPADFGGLVEGTYFGSLGSGLISSNTWPFQARVGQHIAGGDVTGDGVPDLLLALDRTNLFGSQSEGLAGGAAIVFGDESGVFPNDFEAGITVALAGTTGFEDYTTARVGFLGDINGDGVGDMAIAVPDEGTVRVVFGSASLPSTMRLQDLDGSDGFRVDFPALRGGEYQTPTAVLGGDVNRDGTSDLIIGVATTGAEYGYTVVAHVVFGGAGIGGSGVLDLTTPLADPDGFSVQLADQQNFTEVRAARGDVNGDGFADLIIGSPEDPNQTNGRVYVVFNPGPQ